jgi:hypothetical protein
MTDKQELLKIYEQAEKFKEKYDEATAYNYLMDLLYYKINGEFKKD